LSKDKDKSVIVTG